MDSGTEIIERKREELVARSEQMREQMTKIQAAISVIGVKVELLDELLATAKQSGVKADQTEPLAGMGKYTGVPMMQAVEDVINRLGNSPSGISVTEICERLTQDGFSGTKSLYSSVYVTCERLVTKGNIQEFARDGKKVFSRISPPLGGVLKESR